MAFSLQNSKPAVYSQSSLLPTRVHSTALHRLRQITRIDHLPVKAYVSSLMETADGVGTIVESVQRLRECLFDALVLMNHVRIKLENAWKAHRPLLRGLMSVDDLQRLDRADVAPTNPSPASKPRKISRVKNYHSTFISYGSPDEAFAERLNRTLVSHGLETFFFKESAIPGERLHRVMSNGINQDDRVILICSKDSLNRAGVLNEMEQVLSREAREGGSEILLPVRLDDYLFQWKPANEDIARQIRDRVVLDFSNPNSFHTRLPKLLSALENADPAG